eukprot:3048493-Rhodomonas_salina.1
MELIYPLLYSCSVKHLGAVNPSPSSLPACYALSGTGIRHACYALSGTEIRYRACDVRYGSVRRECRTEKGHGAGGAGGEEEEEKEGGGARGSVVRGFLDSDTGERAVSYTHLTLPTICSV